MWPRPLLFGHRGAPATGLPENTIASFTRALADGATAIETDVHRTRDGHVVVAHDPAVRGVPIKEANLDELRDVDLGRGERMPLLREVLDLFRDVPVNVDIKQQSPAMEQSVVDVVRGDAERVLLASFHVDVLARVRKIYAGPTGLSKNEVIRLFAVPAPFARAWRIRGARAQVPRRRGRVRFDTRRFVDKCHAIGVAVDFWVINDVVEAKELLALGADGIMSDAPGVVKPAFT